MIFNKDYYRILGVIPSAEDFIIRAAYKALAQRYHPDKYQGDPDEAVRLMQEINEAYAVLSDPVKKKAYDEWLQNQNNSDEYQAEEQDDELEAALRAYDKDWNVACEIFPDLITIIDHLGRIAARLSMTYKILMLESKDFQNRQVLADLMERNFFELYFGRNPDILQFAKELVYGGYKQAAKKLNSYIRVLGSDIDSQQVIDKICADHGVPNSRQMKRQADEIERNRRAMNWVLAKELVESENIERSKNEYTEKQINLTVPALPKDCTYAYNRTCLYCGYKGTVYIRKVLTWPVSFFVVLGVATIPLMGIGVLFLIAARWYYLKYSNLQICPSCGK